MDRKDAYIFAIENELKSSKLYKILEASFKDEALISTFHTLASFESVHFEKLVEAFRKEYPDCVLRYDHNVKPKIKIERDLSDPRQIFEYAIDREIAMADQYEEMAEGAKESELKAFFLELAGEERNHREMIEMEFNRLHGSAIWFDSSELNGLMEY